MGKVISHRGTSPAKTERRSLHGTEEGASGLVWLDLGHIKNEVVTRRARGLRLFWRILTLVRRS